MRRAQTLLFPLISTLLFLTVPVFGRSYTTNFASPPAPENPILEGSNWLNGQAVGLDWNNVKTTSGLAQSTQSGSSAPFYDDATAILTGTWGPDQTVQITAKGSSNPGGVQEVEIRLRSTMTAHSSTGYEVDWTLGGLALVRWNGPYAKFTQLATANVKYANGDVLKASIVNTLITVYRNGVSVLTHDTAGDTAPTDGSGGAARYSAGNPGFGIDWGNTANDANDFGITSFTATDSGSGAPSPPTGLSDTVN